MNKILDWFRDPGSYDVTTYIVAFCIIIFGFFMDWFIHRHNPVRLLGSIVFLIIALLVFLFALFLYEKLRV